MIPSSRITLFVFALIVCALTAREQPPTPDTPLTFGLDEIRAIRKLSPLPELPQNPTNAKADDPDAARFGQSLFYDPRLSRNGEISCATCHDPAHSFSDGKQLSQGLDTTERHSMALWNVAYQHWFFWDGRVDSLWSQSTQPLQNEKEMGASLEHLLAVVTQDSELKKAYESIFGLLSAAQHSDARSLDHFVSNLGKAFEAYQRQLISNDSPFDRFVVELSPDPNPGNSPLSDAAQRGLKLFIGRGKCILCHAGPNLSDGEFHNIGLPLRPGTEPDKGRFVGIRKVLGDRFNGLSEFSDDRGPKTNIKLRYLVVKINHLGEFKTPTLRNVAETAPYMHDGRFATLREVLDFYSEFPDVPANGHREETLQPLKLTDQEKADLEAFLSSLTGAPIDESLIPLVTKNATVAE